jgi:hypothetical protein
VKRLMAQFNWTMPAAGMVQLRQHF